MNTENLTPDQLTDLISDAECGDPTPWHPVQEAMILRALHELARLRSANETRDSRLRAAAQAVVDRWDTPLWKDASATANYINALRMALALPIPDFLRNPENLKAEQERDSKTLDVALRKLSGAMGNPCLHVGKHETFESALIDEARRRIESTAQPTEESRPDFRRTIELINTRLGKLSKNDFHDNEKHRLALEAFLLANGALERSQPTGAAQATDEHDAGIIRDLEAMAANQLAGFWPRALAAGALRLIKRAPQPTRGDLSPPGTEYVLCEDMDESRDPRYGKGLFATYSSVKVSPSEAQQPQPPTNALPTLVKGATYETETHGPVEYVGLDCYFGDVTHHFRSPKHGDIYRSTTNLGQLFGATTQNAGAPQS
jgi:hypothetical protein